MSSSQRKTPVAVPTWLIPRCPLRVTLGQHSPVPWGRNSHLEFPPGVLTWNSHLEFLPVILTWNFHLEFPSRHPVPLSLPGVSNPWGKSLLFRGICEKHPLFGSFLGR